MLNITADQVLAELSYHQGRANGIHVHDLAMRITGQTWHTEAQERLVRKLVNALRLEGHAICAHPGTGYYLAQNTEELDETCNFLRSRAMSSLKAEARLRKISVTELLGQFQRQTTESAPS
jgi:hypothetical protein